MRLQASLCRVSVCPNWLLAAAFKHLPCTLAELATVREQVSKGQRTTVYTGTHSDTGATGGCCRVDLTSLLWRTAAHGKFLTAGRCTLRRVKQRAAPQTIDQFSCTLGHMRTATAQPCRLWDGIRLTVAICGLRLARCAPAVCDPLLGNLPPCPHVFSVLCQVVSCGVSEMSDWPPTATCWKCTACCDYFDLLVLIIHVRVE